MDTDIMEKTEFKFAELSDAAKERAIEWYRTGNYQDWEPHYDTATEAAKLLGFEFDTRSTRRLDPNARDEPDIHYWIGSYRGEDFVTFEGRWRAVNVDYAKLLEEWPQDEELQRIGAQLMALVLRHPQAKAALDTAGRDSSEQVIGSWAELNPNSFEEDHETELDEFKENIVELATDFGEWIKACWLADYEWIGSEEYCIEGIEANDYTFDEDGDVI